MPLSYVARLLAALIVLAAFSAFPGALQPLAKAQAPARVAFVHAAPLAGPDTVTFAVNAGAVDRRLGAVAYSGKLAYEDVSPGSRVFKLFAGNLEEAQLPGVAPVLSATIALEAGKDYTLIAVGGARSYQLELLRLEDNAAKPAAGRAKLRVIHAAPFAEPVAATEIDIIGENRQAIDGLTQLGFRSVSRYVEQNAGQTLDLKAVPTGFPDGPTIFDLPPIMLRAGEVRTIIALGGANGRPVTLLEQDQESRLPTKIRVVQAAPAFDQKNPLEVALNGEVVWSDLSFATATPAITRDEGRYTITVQQPGEPPGILASLTTQLRREQEYILLIRPDAEGEGLELRVEPSYPEEAGLFPPNRGLLRVYHVAPFHTDDRSLLDLRNRLGQPIDAAFTGMRFGDQREAFVPVREWDLLVTSAGGGEVFDQVGFFTLDTGRVATIIIVGSQNDGPSDSLLLTEPRTSLRPYRTYLPMMGRR